jgi:hypothetical protein
MKKILTVCIIIFFLLLVGGYTSLLFAGQVTLEWAREVYRDIRIIRLER